MQKNWSSNSQPKNLTMFSWLSCLYFYISFYKFIKLILTTYFYYFQLLLIDARNVWYNFEFFNREKCILINSDCRIHNAWASKSHYLSLPPLYYLSIFYWLFFLHSNLPKLYLIIKNSFNIGFNLILFLILCTIWILTTNSHGARSTIFIIWALVGYLFLLVIHLFVHFWEARGFHFHVSRFTWPYHFLQLNFAVDILKISVERVTNLYLSKVLWICLRNKVVLN